MIGCVSEAAELLKNAGNIIILTHRRPDGDTSGCAGALCLALRELGKTAYIAENPEITKRYADLITPYDAPDGWKPEYIVSVDCAAQDMIAENAGEWAENVDLAIDHHGSNNGFAKYNLVMGDRAACAEIVCEVIQNMGVTLTKDIARGIYVGVTTDTGCFKFSNTTAHTHRVAAECLETGLDGGEICRALFEVKSKARFEIERIINSNMKFYKDGKIAVVLITLADRKKTGVDWDDLDAIAGLTRQIEGVETGLTFTELENGSTKLSVRTTKEVDAAAICTQLGGGGHIRAAGATIALKPEQAILRTLEAAERVYQSEKKSV